MKKPTLKNRLKRHDTMVAPPTNSSNISKMPDSPKGSTKMENTETWGKGKVFVTVLKIFFLVVVALVTDRTVSGVSMSAFSLFFIENVVKYLYELYKYLFVSQTMKKSASFSSIEGDDSAGDSIVSDCSSLNVSSEETQDVQAESDSDIQVSRDANFDHKKNILFEDIDNSEKGLENNENCNGEGSSKKRRGYRREKVKSKIKKLLSKKIRRSMKKRSSSKQEDLGLIAEVNFKVKECDTGLDDEKDNISVTTSDSCQAIKSDSEESVVEAKPQRPTDRITLILDYCYISFIVLAGLVEGQTLVVVLTVAWCMITKLVARMHMKK